MINHINDKIKDGFITAEEINKDLIGSLKIKQTIEEKDTEAEKVTTSTVNKENNDTESHLKMTLLRI